MTETNQPYPISQTCPPVSPASRLAEVEHQRDRLIEELERWQHACAKLERENERLKAQNAVLSEVENDKCEHGSTRTVQGDLVCNICGLNLNSP